MDEVTLVRESLQLVKKDLGLEENFHPEEVEEPFDRLLELLKKRISDMLDSDFAGLLNALYRIDIPEQDVKKLIELSPPNEIAGNIAKAVLDRERQKVVTRQQYRP